MKSFVIQIAALVAIAGYAHAGSTKSEIYYKVSLHIIHAQQHSAREEWQQCSELVSALARRCDETAHDTSPHAFNNSQNDAINTIKKVCALCKNKDGLHIDIDTGSTRVTLPNNGLFIAFEYFVAQQTSYENKSRIAALMQQIRESNNCANRDALLHTLSNLETAFSLMSGSAGLSVHNFIEE